MKNRTPPCYTLILLLITSVTLGLQTNLVGADDNTSPPAQIAAAPARVTVDISKGRAGGSVRVFNLGSEAVSINTEISHWTMDEENKVKVIAPTQQSLDQWLVVNPLKFSIPPGKQQVVRYSIRPRAVPDTGEHRAMLFFNQTSPNPTNDTIDINFRMGVAIYGVAGEIYRSGHLHNLTVKHRNDITQITAEIESTGNGNVRMEGQVSVWPKADFPGSSQVTLYDLSDNGWNAPAEVVTAAVLSSTPVLPGSKREIKTLLTMPSVPGEYIVHVNGTLGSQALTESLALSIQ